MTVIIYLQNDQTRCEIKHDYFFARSLTKGNVIDALLTPRKAKKFAAKVQEIWTEETTMKQIWDIANEMILRPDHSSY